MPEKTVMTLQISSESACLAFQSSSSPLDFHQLGQVIKLVFIVVWLYAQTRCIPLHSL